MTVKTVIIIRHGEAFYPDEKGECLSVAGKEQIGNIARLYNAFSDNIPEITQNSGVLMCSSAPRCTDTASILSDNGINLKKPVIAPSLEIGETTRIFDVLNKLDDSVSHAVLVTHQPNIKIWKDLCKNGAEAGFTEAASGIILEFNSWKDVTARSLMKTKIKYKVSPNGIVPV